MQSEEKNTTLDSGDWLEPKAEGGHPQQSLERTERTVEPFSQLHRWGNESFLQVEQRTVEQLNSCVCVHRRLIAISAMFLIAKYRFIYYLSF